ncbi:MAG: hypothetical protein U5K71_12965 [Gracilimonas sp.]|nr:hypothetical protein [Gracilimonas sp.]
MQVIRHMSPGANFPTEQSYKASASAASITRWVTQLKRCPYLSYFARANYKFSNDRTLLSGSARLDGSSQIHRENSRYGFFPAVSAGWILSQEDFLSEMEALSFLKLRASYGSNR